MVACSDKAYFGLYEFYGAKSLVRRMVDIL